MIEHRAEIIWRCDGDFARGTYSRVHEIRLDSGVSIPGSSSPHVVPEPASDPFALDPEEALVAALSACHMLWFLDHARRSGHEVASYRDDARGRMGRRPDGRMWLAEVDLRPRIGWASMVPAPTEIERLHELAHHDCFIANSVMTEVRVKPA
ncbi:MAG: OsmC family protein [Pseudomonadota bacterium]